jgi:hypothetical protein
VLSCRRSNYWSNCRKTSSRSWIMANRHGEQSKHFDILRGNVKGHEMDQTYL